MEWNHLPVAGGIYDQNPLLLDQWKVIFREVNEEKKRDQEKRERESKRKKK